MGGEAGEGPEVDRLKKYGRISLMARISAAEEGKSVNIADVAETG